MHDDTMSFDRLSTVFDEITVLDVSSHTPPVEIRGAIRYKPKDLLETPRIVLPIAHDRPVIVYDDMHGKNARPIAERLRREGFDAHVLDGDVQAWVDQGGPTQETTLEQIVPPTKAEDAPTA
jgi:3-mercaptopyruvate sulfurtransferase SseA